MIARSQALTRSVSVRGCPGRQGFARSLVSLVTRHRSFGSSFISFISQSTKQGGDQSSKRLNTVDDEDHILLVFARGVTLVSPFRHSILFSFFYQSGLFSDDNGVHCWGVTARC